MTVRIRRGLEDGAARDPAVTMRARAPREAQS
jgi:hypothetical protein